MYAWKNRCQLLDISFIWNACNHFNNFYPIQLGQWIVCVCMIQIKYIYLILSLNIYLHRLETVMDRTVFHSLAIERHFIRIVDRYLKTFNRCNLHGNSICSVCNWLNTFRSNLFSDWNIHHWRYDQLYRYLFCLVVCASCACIDCWCICVVFRWFNWSWTFYALFLLWFRHPISIDGHFLCWFHYIVRTHQLLPIQWLRIHVITSLFWAICSLLFRFNYILNLGDRISFECFKPFHYRL